MKVILFFVLAILSPSVLGIQVDDHPFGQCPDDSNELFGPRVFLADKKDCQKYYVCFDGKPVTLYCFPGQEWNLKKGECDFAANANCVRPIGQAEDEDGSGEGPSGDASLETGSVEKETSKENNSEEKKTSNENNSDENKTSNENNSEEKNTSTENNSDEKKTSNENNSEEKNASTENNSQEKNISTENNSEEKNVSTENDSVEKKTSTENNSQEKNNSTENSTENSDEKQPDEVLARPPEDPCVRATKGQFLAHISDCGQFYICTGEAGILMTCPRGLYFNTITNSCDWAQNVECGVASDPNNPCANVPEGQFLPHETNCGQYYRCVDGEARLKACPSILHFNAKLSACDWPENVKC